MRIGKSLRKLARKAPIGRIASSGGGLIQRVKNNPRKLSPAYNAMNARSQAAKQLMGDE